MVEVVGKSIGTRWDFGDHGARLGLGVAQALVYQVAGTLDAVFCKDLAQALRCHVKRRHQRVDVAPDLIGNAHIGLDDLGELRVERTGAIELHRRDAESLLKDLAVGRRDASRRAAAHVGGVQKAPTECDQLAVEENGCDQIEVGRMGDEPAGGVGIVGEQHVARLPVLDARDDLGERQADEGGHPDFRGYAKKFPNGSANATAKSLASFTNVV